MRAKDGLFPKQKQTISADFLASSSQATVIDPIHGLQAKSSSKETCKWKEQKPEWSQKCCDSMGEGRQEIFNPSSEINLLSSLGVLRHLIN